MKTFLCWLKCKLAWLCRFGLIKRTTAFRWEVDWAIYERPQKRKRAPVEPGEGDQ